MCDICCYIQYVFLSSPRCRCDWAVPNSVNSETADYFLVCYMLKY